MGMTRIIAAFAAAGLASLVAAEAQAQPYPNKPIKIIVPLTAGSPVDVVGRLVGNYLSAALRQPVIVENRPGAGATIGAKAVASAEPDGYTLLHTAANHVIAAAAFKNLTYDPFKDFAPVGATATSPYVVVVTPKLPVKTVPELIAYSKANPGTLNYHGQHSPLPPRRTVGWRGPGVRCLAGCGNPGRAELRQPVIDVLACYSNGSTIPVARSENA